MSIVRKVVDPKGLEEATRDGWEYVEALSPQVMLSPMFARGPEAAFVVMRGDADDGRMSKLEEQLFAKTKELQELTSKYEQETRTYKYELNEKGETIKRLQQSLEAAMTRKRSR